MKKIIALASAAVLGLGVAACDSGAENAAEEQAEATGDATEEAIDTAEDAGAITDEQADVAEEASRGYSRTPPKTRPTRWTAANPSKPDVSG